MAPELLLGDSYDEKCDVFSFAIVMFEVLTESLNPYSNMQNQTCIEVKVANNPQLRPLIPKQHEEQLPWYCDLMRQSWQHEAQKRPSFSTIIQVLEKHM
jgi:serine/threonine protein kinase